MIADTDLLLLPVFLIFLSAAVFMMRMLDKQLRNLCHPKNRPPYRNNSD